MMNDEVKTAVDLTKMINQEREDKVLVERVSSSLKYKGLGQLKRRKSQESHWPTEMLVLIEQ